jgi:hypothetical protein
MGPARLLPMTSLRFRCKVLSPPGLASSTNHDGEEIRETLNEALWATARRFVRDGPSRSYVLSAVYFHIEQLHCLFL